MPFEWNNAAPEMAAASENLLTGWKSSHRLIGALVAAFAVIGLAAGLLPWRIGKGPFQEAALRRLAVALDAPGLTASGFRLRLLPLPSLSVSNLTFAQSGDGAKGRAAEAIIYLKAQSLLQARAIPVGVNLIAPDLVVRDPAGDETGLKRTLAYTAKLADIVLTRDQNTLRRIDIDGGRISALREDGTVLAITDMWLRVRMPGGDRAASGTVRGRILGEEFRLSFQGPSTQGIARSRLEPLSLSYWSPASTIEFDGAGTIGGNLSLKGQVAATLSSTTLHALGISRDLGAINLRATADVGARGANLSDLVLQRGADRFDGAASIRHDAGRWQVSATLATEKFDLGTVVPSLALMSGSGRWSSAPLDLERLFAANIDLRISAEKLLAYGQSFENAALAVFTRSAKAEVSLGDSRYQRGSARFRLSAAPGSFGLDLKMTASVERAELGQLLAEIMRVRRFTGIGNATLALETSGRSIDQFIANAEGKFSANIRNGELLGIDLARLASRRDIRPELSLAAAMGGKTGIDSATLTARISAGAANPVEGHLQSGRLVGTLQGITDFTQVQHAFTGALVQTISDGVLSEPAPVMDFSISGPLFEPRFRPTLSVGQQRRS